MRKILLTAVLTLMTATMALAIPAKHFWRTVKQPDGTELKLMLIGDERLHYFITEDSVPVLENNNAYYYADGIGFGMKRSNILAHDAIQRNASEMKLAKTASVKRIEGLRPFINHRLFAPTRRVDDNQFYTSDHRTITGKHKSIVVLCEFPNRKFLANHDSTYYWNMVNQEGYTNNQGAIGSVHDYFKDQSNGQLDLTFDVVGPIEMDYSYNHYGGNGSFSNGDNGWEFAYEALSKVYEQYPDLNWSDYDWDGDGEVENLYLIYAGYGEATGGASETLWPAQTNFDDYNNYYGRYSGGTTYNLNFDGVRINTFAYGNELYGGSSSMGSSYTTAMGMGVMTHEFSHCLGFPDLYNTEYSGTADMGYWSILAAGSYGGPNGIGWVPTGYTAYEKWAAGWIDYKEFQELNDTISGLKSTYHGGNAYVVYNDRMLQAKNVNALEYFVFENRTKDRWDTYIPAQGLEVLHVNYSKSVWDNNSVNSGGGFYGSGSSRSNMILVPADNSNNSYNEAYDLWPYNRKDSITPNSRPNLTFYNSQTDGTTVYPKSIVQIQWHRADSTVSFIFNPVDTMFTPAPKIVATYSEATANSGKTIYYRDSTTVEMSARYGNIRYSFDKKEWKDYTEPIKINSDDSTYLYAYAWREGKDTSAVDSVLLIKQRKLKAPVISGDTVFVGSTRVTITAEHGRIRYARGNGNFRSYTGRLSVSSSTTIHAFAYAANDPAYSNSDTVSVTFRRMEVCRTPTIVVTDDSTSITLTTSDTDGHIWYTTDSTADFQEYATPIDITSVKDSITVWAYVAAEGKVTSDTVSFTYVAPDKSVDAIRAISASGMTGRISVFTVGGQPVAVADRVDSISLRPGLYIVRDENGKTRKITVK